jgi:hypothetical protein
MHHTRSQEEVQVQEQEELAEVQEELAGANPQKI